MSLLIGYQYSGAMNIATNGQFNFVYRCKRGHHHSNANDVICKLCLFDKIGTKSHRINLGKKQISVQFHCGCPRKTIINNIMTFDGVYVNFSRWCKLCDKKHDKMKARAEEFKSDHILGYLMTNKYVVLKKNIEYIKEDIDLICPKGHLCQISPYSFVKEGKRCKICTKSKYIELSSIEDISKMFSADGYKLLSTEYSYDKLLKYRCTEGHQQSILLRDYVNGKRCPKC